MEILLPLVALVAYYTPFFFPETQFVPIHDVFDGHIAEDRAVRDFYLQGWTQANYIAGGSTPVWAMSRFIQPLSVIPNLLLPILPAYLAVDLIVRVGTYLSFRLLASRLLVPPVWGVVVSLLISVSITFSNYGFGLAGFGLLLASAIRPNANHGVGVGLTAALLFIGWNTSITVHAIFVATGFVLATLVLKASTRFGSVLKLSGIYLFGSIIGNFNIIYAQFLSGVVWQRAEFECYWCTLDQALQSSLTSSGLLTPFFLAYSYHISIPLTLLVGMSTLIALFGRLPGEDRRKIVTFLLLGIVIPFTAPFVRLVIELEALSFLPAFQFDRFALWGHFSFVLAILLSLRHSSSAGLRRIAAILAVLQLAFSLLLTSHTRAVYNNIVGESVLRLAPIGQKYDAYIREDDYAKIREFVGNERTMSIGLDPAPAILNQIFSANGYLTLYPLSYKWNWSTVIQEVIRGTENEDLFNKWGSVIYSFADSRNIRELNLCSEAGRRIDFAISGFLIERSDFQLLWSSPLQDLFLYALRQNCS
jgi:hypothetical protein